MEKSKLLMIVIIVLLVVLLATVAGVAVYVLRLIGSQNQAVEENKVGVDVVKTLAVTDMTNVPVGDQITTNLKVSADGKAHTARVQVYFSYDKTAEKETEEFAAFLAEEGVISIARSVAIDCINSVTAEEVETTEGKAVLADTIMTALQEKFDTALIVSVFFDDWVIV